MNLNEHFKDSCSY